MSEATLENLLIVSDLHLSEGWLEAEGEYSRYEDFFCDAHFFAFLRYHQECRAAPRYAGRRWQLIFNGDTFDFVQVASLPAEGDELEAVCGVRSHAGLDKKQRKYGLGTSSAESVWKLQVIARGHPHFFAALGWFIAQGNRILLIKGNHDPELYWPAVQAEFCAQIVQAYDDHRRRNIDYPPLSREQVDDAVTFEPWFYYEAARGLYVEHGGQYEPANHFTDFMEPLLEHRPDLLELPRGILLTRYVYNALEATHPYADNIRPATRTIAWMLRENPLFGTAVFLRRLYDLFWAWGEINRMERLRHRAAVRRPPRSPQPYNGLSEALVACLKDVADTHARFSWQVWGRLLVEQVALGWLSLMGLVAAIVGVYIILVWQSFQSGFLHLFLAVLLLNVGRTWAAFVNADAHLNYMPRVAQQVAACFNAEGIKLRGIFLGHTHIPQRTKVSRPESAVEDIWVVNTGTWIPIAAQDTRGWETRLVFARLAVGAGAEEPPEFLEWNTMLGEPYYPLLH